MKHSYICYAAISESKHFGNKDVGIFEFDNSFDQSGKPERYYKEWHFDPEIIADCAYVDKDSLMLDMIETNCPATEIKKYRITVEDLND